MKLIVKVVEAKYSDTPQVAIVDMTPEFFTRTQKVISNAPVKLRLDNGLGDYFFVDRKDLPNLVKAAEGRAADWDEFTHLVLEDELWSRNWHKIEVHDGYMIFDQSGLYFKATDAEGFDYLTAPLNRSEVISDKLEEAYMAGAAATR